MVTQPLPRAACSTAW